MSVKMYSNCNSFFFLCGGGGDFDSGIFAFLKSLKLVGLKNNNTYNLHIFKKAVFNYFGAKNRFSPNTAQNKAICLS
jgi:hypothetical protein